MAETAVISRGLLAAPVCRGPQGFSATPRRTCRAAKAVFGRPLCSVWTGQTGFGRRRRRRRREPPAAGEVAGWAADRGSQRRPLGSTRTSFPQAHQDVHGTKRGVNGAGGGAASGDAGVVRDHKALSLVQGGTSPRRPVANDLPEFVDRPGSCPVNRRLLRWTANTPIVHQPSLNSRDRRGASYLLPIT